MKRLALIFTLVLPLFVGAQHTQGPIESLEGSGKLILTFDDGPSMFTPKMLKLLKKHNVTATFFIMGNKINDQTLPLLERIINEGHILASHNWTHEWLKDIGIEQWKINYEKSMRAIVAVYDGLNLKPDQYYFRAPFGYFPEELQEAQREVNERIFGHNDCAPAVGWSVKSADWRATQFATEMTERILWQVADADKFNLPQEPKYTMPRWNGGLLLAHDGISLEELAKPAKGLRPLGQVIETIKAVEAVLEVREKYGFEIGSLDDVEEFLPPENFECELRP